MKESPGRAGALVTRLGTSSLLDARRYYPKAQIRQGAEPNATFLVGADGEIGDFNGLTLSASGPVFLGSRGFSSGKGSRKRPDPPLSRTTGRDLPRPAGRPVMAN
jgi:hypothetical protein